MLLHYFNAQFFVLSLWSFLKSYEEDFLIVSTNRQSNQLPNQ